MPTSSPFDKIFQELREHLNNQASGDSWLPNILKNVDNPSGPGKLLPLIESNWSLGDVTGDPGQTFGDTIKDQWWMNWVTPNTQSSERADYEAVACPDNQWPDLLIPAATFTGLYNAYILPEQEITQTGPNIFKAMMTLEFGYYSQLDPVKLAGKYEIKQCVCAAAKSNLKACSDWLAGIKIDGKPYGQTTYPVDGTGDISVIINDMYVDGYLTMTIDESATDKLQVQVDKLVMRGPTASSYPTLDITNLTIDTSLEIISEAVWIPQAKSALESEDGRQGITNNLNTALKDEGTRNTIGQVLQKQINDYLRNNHDYPYNGAFMALF
jgi:hypothetical protein